MNDAALATKPNEKWFENTWWWRIKKRLQWTDWLQYIPNIVAVLITLAIAGFDALTGRAPWLFVGLPLALSALFAANLIYDLATVRYGLHPAEALPHPPSDIDDLDVMLQRRSCRSFQKRMLTEAHRNAVLELAAKTSAPKATIGTAKIRLEYINAPLTVWPVVGAREFLVAVAPKIYDELAVIDIGRALEKLVIEATRLGVATCWIGPGANPASIAAALGNRFDPARDHVICVCAIGYASNYLPITSRLGINRLHHQRLPLDTLFFSDALMSSAPDFDSDALKPFARCFEACRFSPSSYNAQPTRAALCIKHGELQRVDFLAATYSRYYAVVALGIWVANWEIGTAAFGIKGRIQILPAEQRGAETAPDLPRYLLSWERV